MIWLDSNLRQFRRWSTVAMAGVLALTMTGLVYAKLPVGTVALYSDGYAQKLLRYAGNQRIWEDVRKRQYAYDLGSIQVERSVTHPIDPARSYTAELVQGNPAVLTKSAQAIDEHFIIRRQYPFSGREVFREWSCQGLGSKSVRVVNVKLKVKAFSCERIKFSRDHVPRVAETRYIEYAPSLKMVTTMVRTRAGKTKSRELMFLIPPEQVTAKKIAQLQRQIQRKRLEQKNEQR